MKRTLLAGMAACGFLIASAGVDLPYDFSKDFESCPGLLGWYLDAPDAKPAQSVSQYFPDYSVNDPVNLIRGSIVGVWTVSAYADGQASDTWIITPEFTVTDDEALLNFNVDVYGMNNTVTSYYYVYLSESGYEKEDFTTQIYSGNIKGSSYGANDVNAQPVRSPLKGYKGKKVRLAFVNRGNTVGMMGFGDISVGSWYATQYPSPAEFTSMLVDRTETSGGFDLDFQMRVSTPITARNWAIDFKTAGGYSYTTSVAKRTSYTSLTILEVKVPKIPVGESEAYTLTITPDFEGAKPAVFSGYIVPGDKKFPSVGVMEEATGTWCVWCPYGTAAMGYYPNKYNGLDGNNKVFAIALHDNDPMEIPASVSDYYSDWSHAVGIGGLPALSINRLATVSPSPEPTIVGEILESLFSEKSFASVKLNKVYYDPESANGEMVADYTISTGFNTTYAPITAQAVITENNVQGSGMSYIQYSQVWKYGDNATTIAERLGEDWVPYFEPFFGVDYVFPTQIQYQHVARGSFPSYFGVRTADITAGVDNNGRIHFEMPPNVKIKENTSVLVLITLESTGEVIAADEMDYDFFTFESGVDAVEADSAIRAYLDGDRLMVETAAGGTVEAYGIDGLQLLSAPASAGNNAYQLGGAGGVIIVNVSTPSGSRQFKLVAH